MSSTMTIEMASNGYILTFREEDERDEVQVLSESDEEDGEIKTAEALLWSVLDWSGHSDSRHDKDRLYIGHKVGDKYEGKDREALEKKYKEDAGID